MVTVITKRKTSRLSSIKGAKAVLTGFIVAGVVIPTAAAYFLISHLLTLAPSLY